MANAKTDLVKSWLKKALHDLGSASRLANDPDPFLDTAIYHCQQAAEKVFKAYLVFHDVTFEKQHNLSILLEQCEKIQPEFQNFSEAASTLTPYATAFRYPSEFFEQGPDDEQVREALRLARQIYEFVLKHLPEDVHP